MSEIPKIQSPNPNPVEGYGAYPAAHLLVAQEQVEALMHDPVTGLLNRAGFDKALDEATIDVEKGEIPPFAVAFLDLDAFKEINDTSGHAEGDATLAKIAVTIENSFREDDTIGHTAARVGGDEYMLILTPRNDTTEQAATITDPQERAETGAIVALERVHKNIDQMIAEDPILSKHPLFNISSGWSVWQPGDTRESISKRADAVLQHNKELVKAEKGSYR